MGVARRAGCRDAGSAAASTSSGTGSPVISIACRRGGGSDVLQAQRRPTRPVGYAAAVVLRVPRIETGAFAPTGRGGVRA